MRCAFLFFLLVLDACGARTGLGAPDAARRDGGLDDAAIDAAARDAALPRDAAECGDDRACDDGVACTQDRCVSGRCARTPQDASCDDGRFCTGVERCVPGVGCVATPPDCADPVECSVDACDPRTDACVHRPEPDRCPISHRCDLEVGCVARALAHDERFLFEVDLPTGQLHTIGVTGIPLTDLALHPDGTLYGAVRDWMVRVDYRSSRVERIASVPGFFVGLDVSPEGVLFGATDDRIVQIDRDAGLALTVATFPDGLRASGDLAFVEGVLYATATEGRGADDLLVEVPLDGRPARTIGRIGQPCVWGLAPFGGLLYGLGCEGVLMRLDRDTGRATELARGSTRYFGAGAR